MLSPMYIAELAPAHFRGKLVSFNQFAILLRATSSLLRNLFYCPFR
ncbi:MFS transporter [Escherichia coli]